MADPIIVPPPPTINQGDDPANLSDAAAARSIQAAFDKKLPPARGETPPKPPESPKPPIPPTPEAPKEISPPPAEKETPAKAPEPKVPSFIEQALKVEPSKSESPKPAPDEAFPEEVPEFKSPEERKARYKAWRDTYQKLKEENQKLASRPAQTQQDTAIVEKLSFLEGQNKEMREALNRVSVETHQEFQQKIIQPLTMSWNEACRIVHESGGDPAQLGRALSLQGKAQFEALDEIFAEMPESARTEAQDAIRTFKRYNEARQAALANAPQTAEALRKADLQRQYATLDKQRDEMRGFFEDAVKLLKDDAKVELLMTSSDPDAKEWNEQAEAIVSGGRKLYLENSDLRKMAMACVLAPMADGYRKLWMSERAARLKAEDTIKERFGAEPTLSEGSGGGPSSNAKLKDDLKRPFHEVFIEKFHQLREQGR